MTIAHSRLNIFVNPRLGRRWKGALSTFKPRLTPPPDRDFCPFGATGSFLNRNPFAADPLSSMTGTGRGFYFMQRHFQDTSFYGYETAANPLLLHGDQMFDMKYHSPDRGLSSCSTVWFKRRKPKAFTVFRWEGLLPEGLLISVILIFLLKTIHLYAFSSSSSLPRFWQLLRKFLITSPSMVALTIFKALQNQGFSQYILNSRQFKHCSDRPAGNNSGAFRSRF